VSRSAVVCPCGTVLADRRRWSIAVRDDVSLRKPSNRPTMVVATCPQCGHETEWPRTKVVILDVRAA
jgi:RNase P subunit RPR2